MIELLKPYHMKNIGDVLNCGAGVESLLVKRGIAKYIGTETKMRSGPPENKRRQPQQNKQR